VVQHASERVEVAAGIGPAAEENLRGGPGGAARLASPAPAGGGARAEIDEDRARTPGREIEEEVVGLQVPVEEASGMEVAQGLEEPSGHGLEADGRSGQGGVTHPTGAMVLEHEIGGAPGKGSEEGGLHRQEPDDPLVVQPAQGEGFVEDLSLPARAGAR
jgi:hypothetical protein